MRNKFSKVSNPNDFITYPGEEERIIYSAKVKKDGTIELIPTGKENISEYINSFAESTDISFMVKRLLAGDSSVLRDDKFYMDFTKMPETYAEVLQLQIDAVNAFNELPSDIRNKYDNNPNVWLASAGSQEWFDDVIPKKEVVDSDIKEDITDEP